MPQITKGILEAEVVRLGELCAQETQKVFDLTNVDEWTNERMIEGERAYPLFAMTAHYERDCNPERQGTPSRWQIEGVAKGRIKDRSTWGARGFREWPDEGELVKWSHDRWKQSLKRDDKYAIKKPTDLILTVTFRGWAVWWLCWFQHATFDVGLDDAGVLDSFQRHVGREVRRARHAGKEPCLMGAEEHWRWCGAEPDKDSGDRSPPPCRCEHCKDQGLVRIVH